MRTQELDFRSALEELARRTGTGVEDRWTRRPLAPPQRDPEPARGPAHPDLIAYVDAAEQYLWSERGHPFRRWLESRGFSDEVVRLNRVGADPGPRDLARADGLPRRGPAIVLPVLEPGGQPTPIYLQARYLHPSAGRKYDNPATALAGPSPRLAIVRSVGLGRFDQVIVCEGIPDALTAAQRGHRTAAVLGAGAPNATVAAELVERHPAASFRIAFDADARGDAGAQTLERLLREAGAPGVSRLRPPAHVNDLNAWAATTRRRR